MGITSPPEVGEEKVGQPIVSPSSVELVVDPIACDGRSVCAEIAPTRDHHRFRDVCTRPRQTLDLVERPC
jgi:hypothetical protein